MAKRHDIPIILHSRKAEERVFELLQEEGVVKADFHCFMGKVVPFTYLLPSSVRIFLFSSGQSKLGQRIAAAGEPV